MVRILGLYFDCQLNWKQHILQITNRVKQKLYQLHRITFSKYCNLSPTIVSKLYLSTIRPIMEFGTETFGTTANIVELEKLQQRAL